MNYFLNIPIEVITSIAKDLDMKSLCNLIMSSKEFKSLCDTNDIWKYHYLKTIQDKWKITEDSVHIGGGNKREQKYLYEFNDGFGETYLVTSYQTPESHRIQSIDRMIWDYTNNVKFIKELGCDPYIYYYSYDNSVASTIMLGCMKSQIRDIIKSDVTFDYSSDQKYLKIGFVYGKPDDMEIYDWKSDIYKKWKTFNESQGLKNLCQNPAHYDINTLEIPCSCRGFKNYKKVVVKKLLTKSRKDGDRKTYERRIKETNDRIKTLRERIKDEQKGITLYNGYLEKEKEKDKRFQEAIDCM